MGWDRIVDHCHMSLKSLTPNQQRPFQETKQDIFDGFENFKANAQISKELNLIHFSSLLKRRVQSRLTAVAAISSASCGAGADAGHKSCWHLCTYQRYTVLNRDRENLRVKSIRHIAIRSVSKMFSRPIINNNPCSHCPGCSDEDDDALASAKRPCRTGRAPQVVQADSLVFRHFSLLVWDSAVFLSAAFDQLWTTPAELHPVLHNGVASLSGSAHTVWCMDNPACPALPARARIRGLSW